ncbi:MAG: glycosyltransferase family 4 protein [Bacteroidetes bacterium]|nr:glycosyltransferase family 4 protein [Bacteroidota bacterium]
MRILFLCNKSPWPPKEGGPMAMNMLIEGLVDAGHQVKVLAVNSFKYNISADDIPLSYAEKTGIELIDVDLRIKPVDAFLNLFTGESYHVRRFISEKFRTRLIEILRAGKFDIVQLETLFMGPYIGTIRANSPAKIILRAHNIEHLIWERIAEETKNPARKWYLNHLAVTLRNYEQKTAMEVDGILAITPKDAGYFTTLTTHQNRKSAIVNRKSDISPIPVTALPFGLDPAKYRVDPVDLEFPSLFSLGSMNWIPNQEGIRWFLEQVWPDIHNQFPKLNYYIAGREMPGWMRALALPNVVVLGEVEDARAFLASKAIMIVPLFSGSGIRVKIIEGMACGKTIISTSIGAEGISCTHRENILIADAPCEFFEMISICITNPALCNKIGKQARALVETAYNPTILIQKLLTFYQELTG